MLSAITKDRTLHIITIKSKHTMYDTIWIGTQDNYGIFKNRTFIINLGIYVCLLCTPVSMWWHKPSPRARDLAAEKSIPPTSSPASCLQTISVALRLGRPTIPSTMHRQSITRVTRQLGGLQLSELPPPYLAPSLHFPLSRSPIQCSNFSTTAVVAARGRDLSKSRGVSAIHRTGPKFRLGVSKYPLPKPVVPEGLEKRSPNPNHGLWGFFPPDRQALSTPAYDIAFGEFSSHTVTLQTWVDVY